jgi:dolichyl-phosphate-mannose--protein O-mannosyl transferase
VKENLAALWRWLRQPHNFVLTLIFILGAGLRFYHLDYPSGYYFDEVYHVPTARLMAANDPRAYEWWHGELEQERQTGTYIDWLHPPLAKLLQAFTIILLGDHEFGWRAASAAAGSLLVIVVYYLARAVLDPKRKNFALLAAFFIAIDGLALAQSRIAMNDIFVTLFMTMGVFFYLRYRQENRHWRWCLPLALACGASIASKWSGVFLLGFIGLWELISCQWQWRQLWQSLKLGFFLFSASALIYLLAYSQMFLAHDLTHFLQLNQQIISYQINLDATHPYASTAIEWPLGLKPVYFYYDQVTERQIWNRPFYPTWFLSLAGLGLAVALLLLDPIYQTYLQTLRPAIKQTPFFTTSSHRQQLLFITLAYFCFWTPWLFSPRIMFFYHYLPAVPMLVVIASAAGASWYQAYRAIIEARKRKGSHDQRFHPLRR